MSEMCVHRMNRILTLAAAVPGGRTGLPLAPGAGTAGVDRAVHYCSSRLCMYMYIKFNYTVA